MAVPTASTNIFPTVDADADALSLRATVDDCLWRLGLNDHEQVVINAYVSQLSAFIVGALPGSKVAVMTGGTWSHGLGCLHDEIMFLLDVGGDMSFQVAGLGYIGDQLKSMAHCHEYRADLLGSTPSIHLRLGPIKTAIFLDTTLCSQQVSNTKTRLGHLGSLYYLAWCALGTESLLGKLAEGGVPKQCLFDLVCDFDSHDMSAHAFVDHPYDRLVRFIGWITPVSIASDLRDQVQAVIESATTILPRIGRKVAAVSTLEMLLLLCKLEVQNIRAAMEAFDAKSIINLVEASPAALSSATPAMTPQPSVGAPIQRPSVSESPSALSAVSEFENRPIDTHHNHDSPLPTEDSSHPRSLPQKKTRIEGPSVTPSLAPPSSATLAGPAASECSVSSPSTSFSSFCASSVPMPVPATLAASAPTGDAPKTSTHAWTEGTCRPATRPLAPSLSSSLIAGCASSSIATSAVSATSASPFASSS